MAYGSIIKTSAPGSLMLFGEHAVLHGSLSLVAAISRRITVTLKPVQEKSILIKSSFEKSLLRNSSDYSFEGFHRFVIAALAEVFPCFPENGCELTLDSEFSDQLGLGSSAAVTVATVAAVLHWTGATDNTQIFEQSLKAIHKVQGRGSGADIAASVYGGIVTYRLKPRIIEKRSQVFPITVIYSGSKVPTVEVIKKVEEQKKLQPKKFAQLFRAINKSTEHAAKVIDESNWIVLGQLANENQRFMEAMGVCNEKLLTIVHFLQQEKTIFGAKISGAGLGDCIIGIGQMSPSSKNKCPYTIVPIEISQKGVAIE